MIVDSTIYLNNLLNVFGDCKARFEWQLITGLVCHKNIFKKCSPIDNSKLELVLYFFIQTWKINRKDDFFYPLATFRIQPAYLLYMTLPSLVPGCKLTR